MKWIIAYFALIAVVLAFNYFIGMMNKRWDKILQDAWIEVGDYEYRENDKL